MSDICQKADGDVTQNNIEEGKDISWNDHFQISFHIQVGDMYLFAMFDICRQYQKYRFPVKSLCRFRLQKTQKMSKCTKTDKIYRTFDCPIIHRDSLKFFQISTALIRTTKPIC